MDNRYQTRCYCCNKFMKYREIGSAWEACGEFGEETRYICKKCAAEPNFKPQASNGSYDHRWCGIITSKSC